LNNVLIWVAFTIAVSTGRKTRFPIH